MPMGIPIRVHMRVPLAGLLISSSGESADGGLGSASGWVCFATNRVAGTSVGDAGGIEGVGLGGKAGVVSDRTMGPAWVGAVVGMGADIAGGVGIARVGVGSGASGRTWWDTGVGEGVGATGGIWVASRVGVGSDTPGATSSASGVGVSSCELRGGLLTTGVGMAVG